jgi:hypothetical protein
LTHHSLYRESQKNNTFNGLKASDRVLRKYWLLLLEEYGVTFEYLPGKKNVVADALSCLEIDSLKIQEGEVLTLFSESENNSISNIKYTILMHAALIFKEQAKVKGLRLREKGLAQPHYSIQHIEGYDLLCYKEKIYIPQSLRQRELPWYHEYLLHPGQTRTEKTIRNTMTWPDLRQDVEHRLLMFHLSSMSNDKEGSYTQEIWNAPTQNSRI